MYPESQVKVEWESNPRLVSVWGHYVYHTLVKVNMLLWFKCFSLSGVFETPQILINNSSCCYLSFFALLDLHRCNIPVFLLGRSTGRMMSMTLTLNSSGFRAGVCPRGWMQGKADVPRAKIRSWSSFLISCDESGFCWLVFFCIISLRHVIFVFKSCSSYSSGRQTVWPQDPGSFNQSVLMPK